MKKTYELKFTSLFYRQYKRLVKYNYPLRAKIELASSKIEHNPFDPSLKTHSVNTSYFGQSYSSRVTGDIRILWRIENNEIILLLTIGGHDQVY